MREHRDDLHHHDAHHYGDGRILYTTVEPLTGTVTWTWHAAEHLDPALYPLQPHYRRGHWPLINGVYPLADGTVAASLLPDGSLLLFDNGTFRTGESVTYSHAIEVDRPTRAITWQYRDAPPENFFTPFMGSAQRLPNGNTLVTESAFGRIFEVTRDGEVPWLP